MTELGRKRGDERGEGERRTNGNDRESEGRGRKERECPYLLINRPFRKGKTPKIPRGRKKTGGKPGGVVVEGLTEEAGTSNSFSESRSFSGRRFLGVHE